MVSLQDGAPNLQMPPQPARRVPLTLQATGAGVRDALCADLLAAPRAALVGGRRKASHGACCLPLIRVGPWWVQKQAYGDVCRGWRTCISRIKSLGNKLCCFPSLHQTTMSRLNVFHPYKGCCWGLAPLWLKSTSEAAYHLALLCACGGGCCKSTS